MHNINFILCIQYDHYVACDVLMGIKLKSLNFTCKLQTAKKKLIYFYASL